MMDTIEKETVTKMESFQEEAEVLRGCIGKLSPKHKQYLRLRYEQGLSYREIGRQIAVSMQAVYKTMTRIQVVLLNCVRLNLHEDVRV